jgi:hypothetical protein
LIGVQAACTSCRVDHTPSSPTAPAPAPVANPQPPSPPRLVCPELGSGALPALSQSQASSHRVVLSWRASPPANSKHDAAYGYCLYRATEANDPHPQLVNSTPFRGTSCMDDWVENTRKYHYIVRAISARWVLSPPSNSAQAEIPAGSTANPRASTTEPPLCRQPASR